VTAPDRIACCVPFCKRTAARDGRPETTEIICGRHWRKARASRRKAYLRLYRRWKMGQATERDHKALDHLWSVIKSEAIASAAP